MGHALTGWSMLEPNKSGQAEAAMVMPVSLPAKLWVFPQEVEPSADLLAACGGSATLARVLIRRGLTTAAAVRQFLNESEYVPTAPFELPGVEKAVERMSAAIAKGEKITVYGDYDVDGITGTSVLLSVLRSLNANVDFYIPNRSSEGYGLNLKAVSVLASKHRTKLLITCDCGVSNFSEINLAKSLGVDTLVLDHHTMPELLPPAVAVVHPKLLNEGHPLFHLPGVGVAYKVCEALLAKFDRSNEVDALQDYVTLGMIADLVPLVDENRYLVKIGLPKLVASPRPGIRALLAQVGGKEDTDLVGFGLAPRINAVGRLADANVAVELLTTDDAARAEELALQLQRDNARRQELCERIYLEAEAKVLTTCDLNSDKGIAIYNEGWHHGVVGIVASRLVERFQRPVFIGEFDPEDNMVRGSARGVEQIDLYQVLKANEHLLIKWGGHKMAVGFSIEGEKAEAATRGIVASCNKFLAEKNMRVRLEIDSVVEPEILSLDLVRELNAMAPFGMSNRKPVLSMSKMVVTSTRPLGKEAKHSRIMFKDYGSGKEFESVMWSTRGRVPAEGDEIDVAFNPDINNFNGRERLQLILCDWRKAGDAARAQEAEDEAKLQATMGKQAVQDKPKATSTRTVGSEYSAEPAASVASSHPGTQTPTAFKFTFKDLRSFNANPEVVKKAQAKLGKELSVFGESCPKLSGISLLDRQEVAAKKTDHLLIWQFPPSLKAFQELLRDSGASNIYLVGCEDDELEEPSSFLKRLLGLVRYTINQKDGQVEGDKLTNVMGASKMSVALALTAFKKVHWVDWFSENGMIYLDLLGEPASRVEDTPEYKQLAQTLDQVRKFRLWCKECSIKELQLALIPNQLGLPGQPEASEEVVSPAIRAVTVATEPPY
ncbi:MAG: single-stranded-DNA-specific exonuclease [Cyanobacteriota bacterium erpe_2018_sw_21hr_WHONDRS-SW48-000092_B_bin.40]|nr:single-stranded-DNA-specific exonuclease [Cyanobacteriota bacterium erpe_2018_sw_21hr_WHONDRS-SW48-000092_B_bin.40]